MIENWKTQLNNESKIGVVIMDLSKALDTEPKTINCKIESLWFRLRTL